jgi:hypothetical protein
MKIPGTNAGLPRMNLRDSGSISRLAPRFADRRSRIPRPGPSNVSSAQNSNRECIRLEIAVTQRKQRIGAGSNREIEGVFDLFAHGGEGRVQPSRRGLARVRIWHTSRRSRRLWEGLTRLVMSAGEGPCPYSKVPRQRREKKKTAPPESVSIRNDPDRLFCWSCGRF